MLPWCFGWVCSLPKSLAKLIVSVTGAPFVKEKILVSVDMYFVYNLMSNSSAVSGSGHGSHWLMIKLASKHMSKKVYIAALKLRLKLV